MSWFPPLPGDQPNEPIIPIGQTEEETPEPESECTVCGRNDVVTDDVPRCSRHINTQRSYEVEVIVSITLDGDDEAAYKAVDDLMGAHSVWGGTTHYALLEGCVTDVTKEVNAR